MAKQIFTKWIGDDQVIDTKILLRNDQWLRARNAADTESLNLLGLDISDNLVMYRDVMPRSGVETETDIYIDNSSDTPAASSDAYLTLDDTFSAEDGYGSTEIATAFTPQFNGDVQSVSMVLAPIGIGQVAVHDNISFGVSGGGGLSGIRANAFTISGSPQDISKFMLRIRNFGGATGDFTAHIYGDAAGEPDETNILATVSIPATGVPGSFSDVMFTLGTSVNLVPGTYYVALDSAEDDNAAIAYEAYGGPTDAFVSNDGGSSWTAGQSPIGMIVYAEGVAGDLSVIIYSDNAGEPDSVLGQSDPIAREDITTVDTYQFTFSTPVNVNGGTTYWAALVGDSAYNASLSTTVIARRDADAGLYPVKINTGSWVDPVETDFTLRFQVFGDQSQNVLVNIGSSALPFDEGHFGDVHIDREARFMDADKSNYVGFKAPDTVATDVIWTLPDADGSAGQFLQTDGSGGLTWETVNLTPEFSDSEFRIQDNSDATKQLAFEVSGISPSTTRTWTVPDANLNFSTTAGAGGNFANSTLSNLISPTAVNQDLISIQTNPGATFGGDWYGSVVMSRTINSNDLVSGIYTTSWVGLSFNQVNFFGQKSVGATGQLIAKIYNSTGAAVTGTIATSAPIDIASLSTSNARICFTFPSTIVMPSGGKVIGIYAVGITGTVTIWGENTNNFTTVDVNTLVQSGVGGNGPGYAFSLGTGLNLGTAAAPWGTEWANWLKISNGASNEVAQFATSGAGISVPSAVDAVLITTQSGTTNRSLGLYTNNDTNNNSTGTGAIVIGTGNKTAGTGASGDIHLRPGTVSSGTRGHIIAHNTLRANGGGINLGENNTANAWSNIYGGNLFAGGIGVGVGSISIRNGSALVAGLHSIDTTTISGKTVGYRIRSQRTATLGPIGIDTDSTSTFGIGTGHVFIETGDKTGGGAGQSGDIWFKTGTSTGQSGNLILESGTGTPRGKIQFRDGTQGTVGHVWTSVGVNGEGSWAAPAAVNSNNEATFLGGGDVTWDLTPGEQLTANAGSAGFAGSEWVSGGSQWMAQSWTATVSGDFIKFTCKLRISSAGTGTIVPLLYAASAGVPTGGILATSTTPIDIATMDTVDGTVYDLLFPATAVSASSQYAIVFDMSGKLSGGNFYVPSTSYGGGLGLFSNDSGSSWGDIGVDMYFEAYIDDSQYALSFTDDLLIEIKGLDYADNTLPTSESPIVLPNDQDVAYVTPNLSPSGPALTVTVDTLDNVPSSAIVIARRDGNDVIISKTRLELGQTSKLYAAGSGGGGGTWAKEPIVLDATDITNQYIDLANVAVADSIIFVVQGGGIMIEGASYDYEVDYTGGAGGNTRISFVNDLATGGAYELEDGDVIMVQYQAQV